MNVTHEELLKALHTINEIHGLGDAIYEVREGIDWQAEPFSGSSWDHPRVKRYSDAVDVVERALKDYNP